jgi:transketolase|tara:strand:+ start:2148 stop:2618 length:471 start_codon:yes stop_codon:yes gene_type:complete
VRNTFTEQLFHAMAKDEKIYAIVGDVGYGVFDKIKDEYPERYINPGAAEQLIIGLACGLAMEGKIPIAYSITPFILYRPLEFIRNLVNQEKIPVKIVGSGRDEDYGALGFSHYATDDEQILSSFTNLKIYKPDTPKDLDLTEIIYNEQPCYLNLKR